ncbi:unnamed protein product [Vitrella brassicaformis CCMP3155]|uniref:Uncharacterized protein n=1 Tax=Vitrella brassicaformis (strain CCMP3155) TaxID=1169540 RepID=A0A0G4FGH7_VITBC|nr:unnamed protein product [Vitrella brassicaformis CCMP3155]|eukprot:CEM12182.1 unnamed protein product [Vitrella brassicaformis CCMP3155]
MSKHDTWASSMVATQTHGRRPVFSSSDALSEEFASSNDNSDHCCEKVGFSPWPSFFSFAACCCVAEASLYEASQQFTCFEATSPSSKDCDRALRKELPPDYHGCVVPPGCYLKENTAEKMMEGINRDSEAAVWKKDKKNHLKERAKEAWVSPEVLLSHLIGMSRVESVKSIDQLDHKTRLVLGKSHLNSNDMKDLIVVEFREPDTRLRRCIGLICPPLHHWAPSAVSVQKLPVSPSDKGRNTRSEDSPSPSKPETISLSATEFKRSLAILSIYGQKTFPAASNVRKE